MKHIVRIFTLSLLILVLPQCKKVAEPETVYPNPYYPCYPGSWWEYRINDSGLDTVTVSQSYILHRYYPIGYNQPPTEPKLVPFINGKPIYGYQYLEGVRSPATGDVYYEQLRTFLYENKGKEFGLNDGYYSTHYGDMSEHLTIKDKYFNGVDSVILRESRWYIGPNANMRVYVEYTKNIGVTSVYRVDTVLNDTLYKKELINYSISN